MEEYDGGFGGEGGRVVDYFDGAAELVIASVPNYNKYFK